MIAKFEDMLKIGGKSNSLGKTNEIIEIVLKDKTRLYDLYNCLFLEDSWARMRAADAFEKICRVHPDWIKPYINQLASDFSSSDQPSIQWHLAQIYRQVELTGMQRRLVMIWLSNLLSTKDVDWIASANAMDTLVKFTKEGNFETDKMIRLLRIQTNHKSSAVIKRANKYLEQLEHIG